MAGCGEALQFHEMGLDDRILKVSQVSSDHTNFQALGGGGGGGDAV